MKHSPRRRKNWIFWVGVALLCLFWLAFIPVLISGPTNGNIIMIVIFTAFSVGIIILGIRLRRKEPGVEIKLGPEPAYSSQPVRDKTGDKLCTHFLTLGIDAEKLHKHPLEKAGVWGVLTRERHGSLVRVAGKNIGYVSVLKASSEQGTAYHLDYLVPLRDTPSHLCRAKLTEKHRAFWSSEIVDIEWKGETLADSLNHDLTLKQSLLEEFRLSKPFSIDITPWSAYQSAKLKTRAAGTGFHFPSRNMFDCLDRIAAHVIECNGRIAEQSEL